MIPAEPIDRTRVYAGLFLRPPTAASRHDAMVIAADALWDALAATGISWIGFYLKDPTADQLILGPRRDKPACSPIALHGMCGRCFLERCPVIIQDVALLGKNYIACDPRDRSEVVIPLLEPNGSCWGVLDADSHDTRAFGLADAAALTEFVEAIGLSAPPAIRRPPIIL
jgi:putative methionine-R-sulfoxide reductase with GAF domain